MEGCVSGGLCEWRAVCVDGSNCAESTVCEWECVCRSLEDSVNKTKMSEMFSNLKKMFFCQK